MNTPSSRAAAGNGKRGLPVISILVALVLGVAFSNLMIGQRAIVLHSNRQQPTQSQQHDHPSPMIDRRSQYRKVTDNPQVDDDNDDDNKDHVYDGKYITQILLEKEPFPSKTINHDINRNANYPPTSRLKYLPGTLQLTHAQALQHCFVNATHYTEHMHPLNQSLVSISHKYKLIYRNIVKSSSSSARHVMQDFFEGRDLRMKHDDMMKKVQPTGEGGYTMISFIREPLNRFYSQYDEAYFRMGPWMGDANGSIVHDKPKVRDMYLNTKYKMDKYPYLYEGMNTIEEFRPYYCPMEILHEGLFLHCDDLESIDNGTLAERFTNFVMDYSGLDPFDIQLRICLTLQVANIAFPSGEPFPITTLYNATEAERGWQEIARQKGVTIPSGEMKVGRKKTRRFNMSLISNRTKRKICRIMALDYCCLNIELPEVCRAGNEDDGDETVYCAMEKRNNETMQYALTPLVIHPWKDP